MCVPVSPSESPSRSLLFGFFFLLLATLIISPCVLHSQSQSQSRACPRVVNACTHHLSLVSISALTCSRLSNVFVAVETCLSPSRMVRTMACPGEGGLGCATRGPRWSGGVADRARLFPYTAAKVSRREAVLFSYFDVFRRRACTIILYYCIMLLSVFVFFVFFVAFHLHFWYIFIFHFFSFF